MHIERDRGRAREDGARREGRHACLSPPNTLFISPLLHLLPSLSLFYPFPLPSLSPLSPSQYHPDKNPDPAATTYFAEHIAKAYKALTDETARENYEKHGHPDGPQGMRMNIALPEWMFVSDAAAAPAVLAVLVFGCVLAPLAGAAWYILSAAKRRSASGVAPETTELFVRSKWAVKEGMTLPRVQDTLVMAYEFIMMPTPKAQEEGLQVLARTLMRAFPDLKEGHPFWKRRPSIVKVHMLLMAHCGREEVPPSLAADLATVLRRCPTFLEEMLKIGNIPRVQGWPYGWLAPTVGCLEMMQCLNQGVPFFVKKPSICASKVSLKSGDIPLAILPHLVQGSDMEAVKRLARHRPPLRTPADLAGLADADLAHVLTAVAGLTPPAAADAIAALQAMPDLALSPALVGIQGEDEDELEGLDGAGADVATLPRPGDILTASVRVLLRRRSHRAPGARPPTKPVVAFTPYLPPTLTRRERWWVIVGDLASNTCFAIAPVDLRAAEAASFDVPADAAAKGWGGDAASAAALASEYGAQVDVKFEAPKADKYSLTVMLVTDGWVGCDRSSPARLRVVEPSRAEVEGRAPRGGAAAVAGAAAAAARKAAHSGGGGGGGGCCGGAHGGGGGEVQPATPRPAGSGSDDEEQEDEEWDSEESGTEESGSDDGGAAVAAARAGTRTITSPAAAEGDKKKKAGGGATAAADGTAAAQAAAAPGSGGGEIGSADDSSSSSSSSEDDSSSSAATDSSSSPSAATGTATTTTTSSSSEGGSSPASSSEAATTSSGEEAGESSEGGPSGAKGTAEATPLLRRRQRRPRVLAPRLQGGHARTRCGHPGRRPVPAAAAAAMAGATTTGTGLTTSVEEE